MEYYAVLLIESNKINGYFRDISETGFNFIVKDDLAYRALFDSGQKVQGILGWTKSPETLEFTGIIQWVQSPRMHDQRFIIVGIKFDIGFILPAYFYKMKDMNG